MYSSVLLFLSGSDLMVIMFVALLLFGGDKLPELARGLGKGIRDFKDASEGVKREINNQINNYEEKKAEEAAVKAASATPVTPAIEEHATPAQTSAGEIPNHDDATTVTAPHGSVPNTVPYVENHGVASNEDNAADEHATEPVKTTHE